eukprot:TRINITY_DN602_c1_g1_i1.p1 TRINITY_DN602_c1_g1~~TRINITY_DN602_c1_g1_i1.p1  ORF type:complete len:101 (-),score=18.67 TRINITY_DN602_c1_g1_i1:92-394(-)
MSDTKVEEKQKDFFTIKKWNAVALWTFGDGQAVKCAICRSLLADICVPCQTEDNVDPNECTIAWGGCGHVFHFHCISKWLQRQDNCPICNQNWEFERYGK